MELYRGSKRKTSKGMSINKKGFIHYCCVSVSEDLNIELETSELMLQKFNKEVYQRGKDCHCTLEIIKAFKENKTVCDMCINLLKNEDKDNSKIHIIWTENQKYRVFSNFYRSFLDRLFRNENIKSKCATINHEIIDNHLNACNSFM